MGRPELTWRLKIAEAIQEAVQRVGGGYLGLEEAIEEEFDLKSAPGLRTKLGRRQLARLARGDNLPISPDQLEILNAYLGRRTPASLLKRLERPNILQQAAFRQHVCFCLGAQPETRGDRIDISRWDVLAHRELQNAMFFNAQPRIDLEDVIQRGEAVKEFFEDDPAVPGRRIYKVPGNEQWWHVIHNANGPSVVSTASTMANHAAEAVMARCFDREPFSTWSPDMLFGFLWSPHNERAQRTYSTFKVPLDMARTMPVVDGPEDFCEQLDQPDAHRLCGVVFNGQIYPVNRPRSRPAPQTTENRETATWTSYGIICGRRFGPRVLVSVAGVTAAATLGCAQAATRFSPDLSRGPATCLVKVEVEDPYEPQYRSDTRRVVGYRIIEEFPRSVE